MSAPGRAFPHWRLACFYACHFAVLGAVLPYLGVYLVACGFTPAEVGTLIAVLVAMRVFAPHLWAWLADRGGRHLQVVRGCIPLAALAMALLPAAAGSLPATVLVLAAYGVVWSGVLPPFEALTLRHLGAALDHYPRVRLWGSVGFIASAAGCGWLLDAIGTLRLPWLVVALLVAAVATAWLVPAPPPQAPEDARAAAPLARVLRRPEVVGLLLACLLMQLGHAPYYALFSVYLETLGYGKAGIGQLWALAVVAEVGLFAVMPRLMARVEPSTLFVVAFAVAGVRWALTALGGGVLPVLVLAQLTHAVTFGLYHAAAVRLVHVFFPAAAAVRGQALYSSLSFGAGGAVGAWAAGRLWQDLGPASIFWLAVAVSVLGGLVAARTLGRRAAPSGPAGQAVRAPAEETP